MRKNIVLLSFLMVLSIFVCNHIQAQIEYAPRIAYPLGTGYFDYKTTQSKSFSFIVPYKISSVGCPILYDLQAFGTKISFTLQKFEVELLARRQPNTNYFDIPITMDYIFGSYRFIQGDIRIAIPYYK